MHEFPDHLLGITVFYDGTNTRIKYNLTPEERNAQSHPANVDTYKAAKASELSMTAQEYDDAVTAAAALAPYSAKGERMEKSYQRLKGLALQTPSRPVWRMCPLYAGRRVENASQQVSGKVARRHVSGRVRFLRLVLGWDRRRRC